MPDFLDTFADQIRSKKDSIGERIEKGRVSELDSNLGELIRSNWHTNIDVGSPDFEVIAVDGSRAIRPLASGAVLYTARALALAGKQRFRVLDVDAVLSKASNSDVVVFVTHKMEWLEFRAAMNLIKETKFPKIALLIDGSLFGRLTHLPRDQPVESMWSFMVEYFKTFYELLELCRQRNILIIGVSKDSRSSFLRDFLLRSILEEELEDLDVPMEDKARLARIFEEALEKSISALKAFRKMKEIRGDKLKTVGQIMDEALAARSDHQLIRNYIDGAGHTVPLELSAPARVRRTLQRIDRDPRSYVLSQFPRSIEEADDEEGFIDYASGVISTLTKFPAMISFHLLLDKRDTPIRIDMPSWTFKRDTKTIDVQKDEKVLVNVNPIISLLLEGYGGLTNYNVWLKRADEEVRLSRVDFDKLYVPRLEKILNTTVMFTRGYRRVNYP